MFDLYQAGIETPRGVFLITFHRGGIRQINFPGTSSGQVYPLQELFWTDLAEDLNRYLSGERVNWDLYPLDTAGYRPFTRSVLEAVRSIPHGQTWSYREAAARAGSPRGWRAAGQALKANRHPVMVPCHRVVRSDGGAGGFSGPAGWKEMLLSLEKEPASRP